MVTCRRAGALRSALLMTAAVAAIAGTGAASSKHRPDPVDALLARMTIEEKIALLHGSGESADTDQGEAGYLAGIPRLGIPPLRFVDGPPGVLTRVPALAPTSTMGLAATFSVEDAAANGRVIAHEAKARGASVVLQPFINMDRDLNFSRAYNTFGEDPFLTGALGAAQIRGIQNEGVLAQAKHFIGYDAGDKGTNVDAIIDDQTLHEVYAAPFQAAVDAGVASIMCSYNKVDGVHACGNPATLTTLLRKQMGFRGFVTSDWGAVHATDFINAGLDIEMSGPLLTNWDDGPHYFAQGAARTSPDAGRKYRDKGDTRALPEERPASPDDIALRMPDTMAAVAQPSLAAALKDGTVSEATITQAARRILGQISRFGLLGRTDTLTLHPQDVAADAAIVERTSIDSAVLLKNEARALPLRREELADLLIIGPNGRQLVAVGNTVEKAVGLPEREIGPLAALEQLTGAKVKFAVANDMDGRTIPADALQHMGDSGRYEPGLERRMWNRPSASVDRTVDFTAKGGTALPVNSSIVWTGVLDVPAEGIYRLNLQLLGARGRLIVDDEIVANLWFNWIHGEVNQPGMDNIFPTLDGLDNLRAERKLAKGRHSIRIEIDPDGSNAPAQVKLTWLTPQQRAADHDAAIAAARHAGKVVVFAWSRSSEPVFRLPGDQDALIGEIAAVNPNTIVVLNTAQPVTLPWLDRVKALVQMWWTGDEGGWATAKILTGMASPAGRLPFTWPKALSDMAPYDPAHPERRPTGPERRTVFGEGLLIGYRWFDRQGIVPLYPFGYGLSYTTFGYAGLRTRPAADGGTDLFVDVTNTGQVAGDEVVQAYLQRPATVPAGVQFADAKLTGFARISLQPGETRTAALHLAPRAFQYWSTAAAKWITPAGPRTVWVGGSSRDRRLSGTIAATR